MSTYRYNLAIAIGCLTALASALFYSGAASGGKPVPAPPSYLVTDLGVLTSGAGFDPGLNNPDGNGVLLVSGGADAQPVVWSVDATTGVLFSVDTLPVSGTATAVNDAAVVAADSAAGPLVDVPGAGVTLLRELGDFAYPFGINNVGDVVGEFQDADIVGENRDPGHNGILWHVDPQGNVTGPIDLGNFVPQDINDSGLMVGIRWGTSGHTFPAMAWFEETRLIVQDLPTVDSSPHPSAEGKALAVNNLGQIVGWSSNGSAWRATLWDPLAGKVTDLGDLLKGASSYACDINEQGQVVGFANVRRGNLLGYAAFLWQNGKMVDLNTLAGTGGELFRASGINNSGHIVGRMSGNDGTHAYLLTPIP